MTADEVARYAMQDYVAESDAEPRRVWFRRREVIAVAVVALAQFGLFAWAMGVADRADAKAARLDAEMLLLQQRCVIYEDGSATCPADTFDLGARRRG